MDSAAQLRDADKPAIQSIGDLLEPQMPGGIQQGCRFCDGQAPDVERGAGRLETEIAEVGATEASVPAARVVHKYRRTLPQVGAAQGSGSPPYWSGRRESASRHPAWKEGAQIRIQDRPGSAHSNVLPQNTRM